ncbi:hypothetical protein GYA93_11995 [Gordonia desulfuricans]|uniref:Uncharacterized protein n=1 Tax=Gordonia desulfuricans TaxID=89051 RepID=A0A7K3LQ10_9ACTN|nr:hypothetical protein [Gordonia desulfuricans]NDK90298.1 hypothetical protein [Gordonia desulfuricans]
MPSPRSRRTVHAHTGWGRTAVIVAILVTAVGALVGCTVSTGGTPTVQSRAGVSAAVPGDSSSASHDSASTSGPALVNVVAADRSGNPINGFVVGQTGASWSSSTIEYCTNALGAATTGVYRCGTAADGANACWPGTGRLLCTFAPWATQLAEYRYSGSLPVLDAPRPDSFPWALELANGRRCVARSGGAWPMPPAGFEFGYSCQAGSSTSGFVFYRAGSSELYEKSDTRWTVYFGDGESMPAPVEVTTAYRPAAQ